MKKLFFTLFLCAAMCSAQAQWMDNIIAQPTHVVGKRINASGEVTSTLEADFTYDENGRPRKFEIPDYELSTTYTFEDEYFIRESTLHKHGHPMLMEDLTYTYEDGKVKTAKITWSDGYDYPKYWEYSYGEDGRLARMDYLHGIPGVQEPHQHFLYEYENEGKTKIQYYWTSWVNEGMKLRQKNVYQYDDEYNLLTRLIENYSVEGELTSSTLDIYSYTAGGKQEEQITQTLTDGEWVNSSIMRYVYDDHDCVTEQQDGVWSAGDNDWNINKRVVFETSEDGLTYTVSFYKKIDDEWVWDEFNDQTILFGSALYNQQRTMRYYHEAEYNGYGHINQFEMTMIYTEEPVYMDAAEKGGVRCNVYPNPGDATVKITAPWEQGIVRFYDLRGKLMKALPFDFSTEINTESWPSGIYLWEIWHDNQRQASGKWVKE